MFGIFSVINVNVVMLISFEGFSLGISWIVGKNFMSQNMEDSWVLKNLDLGNSLLTIFKK